MKCFLMCAGKGERLGSLVKSTPKCLLKVGHNTMLEHWFFVFKKYGVTEVLINTHYLYDKIYDFSKRFVHSGFKITFVYEKELLGTARTLYYNRSWVKSENYYLVAYSDTWMQVDLHAMLKFHKKRRGVGTLGLHKPLELKDQGVVTVDGRKIVAFQEKPSNPKSSYAWAGVMIGSNTLFKFFNKDMCDIGHDLLPTVKEGLNPYFVDGVVLDIGTEERYKKANETISSMGMKALI